MTARPNASARDGRPLRVGVNLLYLLPGIVGGTETYAVSLLQALVARDDGHEYVVFLNREAESLALPASPRLTRVVCPVRAASRPRRYAYEQLRLPRALAAHGVDLVHSLGYVGPVRAPVPHVLTIPDLNYKALGAAMSPAKRVLLGTMVEAAARRARVVLTISEFSRQAVIRDIGIAPGRVFVTHLAGRMAQADGAAYDAAAADVRRRLAIDGPYAVAFGSLSPHKNIDRLVAAFAQVSQRVPHTLIVAGHLPPDGTVATAIREAGLGQRIRITGYLPDADVLPLMRGADAFVMPSLYEGFGLPVLDAQAMEVAIACSTAGSLPEVAGTGALLFEPRDADAIAEALVTILGDAPLRARLVEQGRANLTRFGWDITAARTLDAYRLAVGAATS